MSFRTTSGRLFFAFIFLLGFFNIPKTFCGTDQQVWIGLTDPNDIYNETLITFLPSATDTVDTYHDTYRMLMNPGFDIYSKIGNADFKAQALPTLTNDKTVTLGIDATVSGPYILRLDRLENMDESVVIVLEDTLTGALQNLRAEPLYLFHLDSAVNIQRLKIHFYPPFGFTSTNITCAGNPGALHLSQPGSYAWNYEVKDADNAVIDSGAAFNGIKTLDNLQEGIYTISLEDSYGYALTKQVELDGKEPVVAQFEVSEDELQVGETLHFYDYSVGASNLSWNFGDGTIVQADAFPTHHFALPGTYEVMLTASNADCAQTFSKVIEVADVANGLGSISSEAAGCLIEGNNLIVRVPQTHDAAQLSVYNLMGQTVFTAGSVSAGTHSFYLPAQCDLCIVRLTARENVFSGKISLLK